MSDKAAVKKKESIFKKSDIATVAIILIAFVALMVVIELIQGQFKFFTVANWMNILMQNAVVGIMAMGMTIVMISGGIDLSVGFLASLGGIFVAKAIVNWGWPTWPAILVGVLLCIGLEAGLGAIIAYLEVEPFIITLGGSICFQGISLLLPVSAFRLGFINGLMSESMILWFGFMLISKANSFVSDQRQ